MTYKKDWLLELAGVILILAEIVFVLASIGVVIGLIAMLTFGHGKVLADLAAARAPEGAYLAVIAILVLAWGMLSLSMLFLRQLRAIVGTVNEGDPFLPDNARRLARMGWYALGTQMCEFVGQPLVATYGRYAGGFTWGLSTSGGEHVSLAPLGLAVTLFILARVFRQGAAMREDLDGTV
jgi:ABC-type anion transport system duplicated permease subunit